MSLWGRKEADATGGPGGLRVRRAVTIDEQSADWERCGCLAATGAAIVCWSASMDSGTLMSKQLPHRIIWVCLVRKKELE